MCLILSILRFDYDNLLLRYADTENLLCSVTAPSVSDASRHPSVLQWATLDGMGSEHEEKALTMLLPWGLTKSQPGRDDKLCLEKSFPNLCKSNKKNRLLNIMSFSKN